MKIRKFVKKIFSVAVLVALMLVYSGTAFGQLPDPPGGGTTGSNTDNNQTGSAPIGGGALILLGLTAVYGTRKVLALKEDDESDEKK